MDAAKVLNLIRILSGKLSPLSRRQTNDAGKLLIDATLVITSAQSWTASGHQSQYKSTTMRTPLRSPYMDTKTTNQITDSIIHLVLH